MWVATVCACLAVSCAALDPGPLVRPTLGQPWPRPQDAFTHSTFFVLQPKRFQFRTLGYDCDILSSAFSRYHRVITNDAKCLNKLSRTKSYPGKLMQDPAVLYKDPDFGGFITSLDVKLDNECEKYPHLRMDESYEISIRKGVKEEVEATLVAESIWGILRGLETFVQLTYRDKNYQQLFINRTHIKDSPRFPHRGLLLDTGRHYLPRKIIMKMIDGLECNKMNVLHWHIVDDQSFPYQSALFPSLSEKGAYHPEAYIYTSEDIKEIVEYARLRGVRVLPEFDTPGHTRSWGEGVPNLLTKCYKDNEPSGEFGPVDPSLKETYIFMEAFFGEVVQLFPEKYIHLGGDEVDPSCWRSNPAISEFMKVHQIGDYSRLEGVYIEKLLRIMEELHVESTVWQEVFVNGATLKNKTIVQVWTGPQQSLLYNVTKAGYQAILSSCWYLDHVAPDLYGGGGDWRLFYDCEPMTFSASDEQKKLVLGGEACMWGEYVDATNVISRVWPRASAAGEKLWSAEDVNDPDEAAHRLEEHVCRMRRRGIHAQPPNGPGACL